MIWIKIKYHLLMMYRQILLNIGLKKWLLRDRYGEQILVFHGIDQIGQTHFNSRFVSQAYFEEFIRYISCNFNVISVADFYEKKFEPHTLNIALTFDDGYSNNYKYAIPVLQKYDLPASFYITTIHDQAEYLWPDFVDLISYHTESTEITFNGKTFHKNSNREFICDGKSLKSTAKTLPYQRVQSLYALLEEDWLKLPKESLEDYWRLMTVANIKEICQNPLFTIGGHGVTHANLPSIPIDEAKSEIENCRHILQNVCNHPIEEFAFPFGSYTKELAQYCHDVGFQRVLLVDYNNTIDMQNKALRPRFVVNPHISLDLQLVSLVKGSYF